MPRMHDPVGRRGTNRSGSSKPALQPRRRVADTSHPPSNRSGFMHTIKRTLSHAVLLLALALPLSAQSRDSLTEDILRQDSSLFTAFNTRDVEAFLAFFNQDLEFYHDIDGLSGYASFVESSHRLFSSDAPPSRRLLPEFTEVHPVPGYGAVQIGKHEFCNTATGILDCGTFGFAHVWKQDEGQWRITRVLSYGH